MTSKKLYRIEDSLQCGRQLVARRKILAGELIVDEPALLAGPGFARGNVSYQHLPGSRHNQENSPACDTGNFTQEDASVCLVCCANLNPSSCLRCPSCDLLLCSDQCKSHAQHAQNECVVFPQIQHVWNENKNRSKKSLYNLVIVIRGLHYKLRDATKWAQISNLDSKSEALVRVGAFEDLQDVFNSLTWDMFASSPYSASAKNINNGTHNNDDDSKMNDSIVEAAQHVLGVMRMNAFSSFSESYSREGLFFISSFMSHSCVINTDRQIGMSAAGDVMMTVRASVDIEKDEAITTTYLSLLHSTEERHRIMMSSWLFVCSCKRCVDPTECQSFSGAIICQEKVVSDRSLVCCDNAECSCQTNQNKEATIRKIMKARPADLSDVTTVENWLDSFDTGELLHPNHSLYAHVKLFLCQLYGRQSGGLDALSVSQLKRKVAYCLQILSILDKVCPGLQMCRGVVMFELWCGLCKLQDLKELPVSITYPFAPKCHPSLLTTTELTEMDIREVKKKALGILQYALPNSSEESMANCLHEDDT